MLCLHKETRAFPEFNIWFLVLISMGLSQSHHVSEGISVEKEAGLDPNLAVELQGDG